MAEITEVTSPVTNVPPNSVPANTAPGGALGKDEFLQLLMEQMKNQDPLDPMKSTDTIAQLAQFSSLEQMKNLNATFEGFRKEDALVQSMLLKGNTVQATLVGGESVEGEVESVVWGSDGMTLTINGTSYPMSGLTSLSLAEAPSSI
ncbi:MAG: hypothetical protein A2283_20035 [Lentisphaerae bacterium RIFOXYA12_FULL_48_11]|nr:MAG: hypothetical protein A2283_20035 [Lentisphaerae bacterium RIFOXYA12_FULL_48_11]